MWHHWFKKIDRNYVLFILKKSSFYAWFRPEVWTSRTNVHHIYHKKLMLHSCTCTELKSLACLNILEPNWVISCREWGGPLNNYLWIGMVKVTWLITPCLPHLRDNVQYRVTLVQASLCIFQILLYHGMVLDG